MPDLLEEVGRRYGLNRLTTATRLSGGFANDVYRVDCPGGVPVVVHIKHPPSNAESLDWEHRQLHALGVELPEVLAPLKALDGSTWFWHGNRPVWLVPWVEGGPAAAEDRCLAARALGRLHSCSLQPSARPGHRRLLELPLPEVGEYPADFDPWLPGLHRERAELTRLVTWLERERRPMTGMTHNDIFPGNVLVHRGRLAAVVDWEEADLDWLVWDLASAMWSFCASSGGELGKDTITDFLGAYRAAGGPVPPQEEELIIPLVRARLLLEVLRAPRDRHPQWDQQLISLRAYYALRTSAQ